MNPWTFSSAVLHSQLPQTLLIQCSSSSAILTVLHRTHSSLSVLLLYQSWAERSHHLPQLAGNAAQEAVGHVAGSWLICCPPGVPWPFLQSFAGSKSPAHPGTWGCSSPEAGLCTFLCWAPQNPRPAHFSSFSGSLWVAAQPSAINNSQFCVWNLRRLRKLPRCRRLSTAFTALADLYPAGKGSGYEVTPNSQLREQQRSDLLARGSLSTLNSLLAHAARSGYWK